MNAGAYRCKVTIQKRTTGVNINLIEGEVWVPYYTNYAYVNKLSGSEFWAAAEVAAQSTVRFTFRWHNKLKDVNAKDYRILFDGKPYNITNVDDVQMKHETVKISGTELE